MELKISPTKKQALVWKKLFDRETRYILFGGGAGGGKSWMICEWVTCMALKFPGTKWFIAREELKRLMGSTFLTLLDVFRKHNIPKDLWSLNGQYNYVQFNNGSRIDFLDVKFLPTDPLYERFGSMEFTSGALEEAGEIHSGAFEVLKSRIGRCKNKEYSIPSKILCTCNPKKNWTYHEFYKPWRDGKLQGSHCFIQALYNDNPYTVDDYGVNLSSIRDPIMKQRLMFGNWEYENDPSNLFDYDNILNMFSNEFCKNEKDKGYMSVDVARFGSDKTIIMIWTGLFLHKVLEYSKKDTLFVRNEIERLCKEYNIPRSNVVIDEDGVGGGIVDNLKGCKGFVNNSRPFKYSDEKANKPVVHNFGNLKAQCYFKLSDLVFDNKIGIYKDIPLSFKDKIIEELEQIKKKDPDKDGKLFVTPKDEIKENLPDNRSPDFADALMMRMYFEVAPRVGMVFSNLDLKHDMGSKSWSISAVQGKS